jgi:ligand-binding sensor domain-containing protein/two-component sensor histidine kinase
LKYSLLILSLFLTLLTQAQNQQLIFDRLTIDDGLSDNEVIDITQDDNGFMWIGTSNGLNRYDGWQFVKFFRTENVNGLPSNRISRLAKMNGNFIAVGTDRGLAIVNTRTSEFKRITIPSSPGMEWFANDILYVSYASNKLFVSTRTGIFVYDDALRLISKLEGGFTINDIKSKGIGFASRSYQLNDDTIIIHTDRGVAFFENKTGTLDYLKNSKNPFHAHVAKFCDSLHSYSIGTTRKNVLFLAKDSLRFIYTIDFERQVIDSTQWPAEDVNEAGWPSFFYYATDSTFFFNSGIQGFFLMHYSSLDRKIHVESEKLYPDDPINVIYAGKDKRIWVATGKEGVLKQSFSRQLFNNTSLLPYLSKNNSTADVKGFYRKNNLIYVGTGSQETGLMIFDEQKKQPEQIDLRPYSNAGNDLWNISPWYNDTLAIATQMGLLFYNMTNGKISKPGKNFPVGVNLFPITYVFRDSHNNAWIGLGFGHGVLRYDSATKRITEFYPGESDTSFRLRYPFNITEDTWGNIWFIHAGQGLTRWNYQKQTFDTLITSFDKEGIHYYDFLSVDADGEGNLWLGLVDHGLMKWNIKSGKRKIYSVKSELGDNTILYIEAKIPGEVWLVYRNGIGVLNTNTGNITNFDKTNGLPGYLPTSLNFYYDSSRHKLMLGFENLFTAFDPFIVANTKRDHKIYITQIKDQNDSEVIDPDKEISLKYFQNNLSISFSAIDFDNSINNNYEYRLYKNENSPWINISHQQTVNFINLNPGNYTFQARLVGEKNSVITKKISISYPFYQTAWFYTLCGMLVVSALYGFYRYRINQLLQLQKVRNRISADLHDDIGARLTNINLLSALGEQTVHNSGQVADYLKRIADEVQTSGEALDDIVWSINTKNDSTDEIAARMRRYAADVFDGTSIRYAVNAGDDVLHVKLSMEQRRDLFLVYKEAVNNIHKHAMATNVDISIETKNKNLIMQITDNGKGFDIKMPTHRNGLKNMQYRIEKSKGIFSVRSVYNQGTTVTIQFPVSGSSLKRSIFKRF